jgi:hypothetical protein
MRRFILLAMINITISATAREWRSADGSKTIEAEFGGLKDNLVLLKLPDGKASVLALGILSSSDQDFAKVAQVALNGAQVLTPQSFEIQIVVDGGYIARMGTQLAGPKGPWTFAGETFFLPHGSLKLERGDKLESKLLYYAGNRTFQPIEGDAAIIRAFDLTLDDAVNAELRIRMVAGADPAKLAPVIAEPLIEIVSTRGIALPIGKGYFITETDLLKDAKTLVLHEGGKDLPAKVIKTEPKLGLALISCAYDVEPARLLPRQSAQVGQSIFALSIPLTSTRKNLAPPTLTRGIISKAGSGSTFEHDASIDEDAIGGFVLSDKWEPLGVFFRSASRVEGQRSSRSKSTPTEPAPALLDCLHTASLEKLFIEGEKDKAKRMSGIPSLRSGSLGNEAKEVIDLLRKSTALVVTTHEVKRDPPAPKTAPTASTGTPPPAGGAAQFSLSGSGLRHNIRCRYFNAAKACAATDGKPCKICGG